MQSRLVACVVCTVACGRVGFDPIAEGADEPPFGAPVPVTGLSTGAREEDPTLTADMLEMIFDRGSVLMHTTRATTTSPWSTPTVIAELRTAQGETSPELYPDGLTLLFTSDRAGNLGGGDIYITRRPDRASPWSAPQRITELSSTAYDLSATTTADDRFVVFTSERAPGGAGNADLWSADRATAAGPWNAPTRLAAISSPADDIAPFFHEPSAMLYFASARTGQLDLYRAHRRADGSFDPPTPVTELDTALRESDPWLSPDGTTMFYSAGTGPDSDILVAERFAP
jgi:Tol biopolymer transport system component